MLRFSYSTDPGLARPGWFIDDIKVTATTPYGTEVLLDTDFESERRPRRPARLQRRLPRRRPAEATAPRGGTSSTPGAEAPSTTPTTWRCATAPASTSTAPGQIDRDPIGCGGRASTPPTPTRRTATATPAPTTRRPSRRSTPARSRATTPRPERRRVHRGAGAGVVPDWGTATPTTTRTRPRATSTRGTPTSRTRGRFQVRLPAVQGARADGRRQPGRPGPTAT